MRNYQSKNVVCFGGGTGMPSLLSGLKHNPWVNITAVVNMFDTGGSSGELKDQFGILPPGDVLKCLLALSRDEVSARKILLKRIQTEKSSIHTGGNIWLLGLETVYGDLCTAIDALGQLLDIQGKVLPVTIEHSSLTAEFSNGEKISGETSVDLGIYEGLSVKQLSLNPQIIAHQNVIQAIEDADVLCVGPGSFYTSVLPNFLPIGVKEAVRTSRAPIIFIANLMTEGWGMKNYSVEQITSIVESYLERSVKYVVVNSKQQTREVIDKYLNERKMPITLDFSSEFSNKLITADLWLDHSIARHDQARLGHLVSTLISDC